MKNNWKTEVLRIHKTVVKNWEIFNDEDKRFLALALSGEVGELLNLIKKDWRGDSGDRSSSIKEELADIQIYLELLARSYDVDLDSACEDKLQELYERWPETKPKTKISDRIKDKIKSVFPNDKN